MNLEMVKDLLFFWYYREKDIKRIASIEDTMEYFNWIDCLDEAEMCFYHHLNDAAEEYICYSATKIDRNDGFKIASFFFKLGDIYKRKSEMVWHKKDKLQYLLDSIDSLDMAILYCIENDIRDIYLKEIIKSQFNNLCKVRRYDLARILKKSVDNYYLKLVS